MIRPDRLVVAAHLLMLAGCASLWGRIGFGAAALVVALAWASWAVLLVRSGDDGRS